MGDAIKYAWREIHRRRCRSVGVICCYAIAVVATMLLSASTDRLSGKTEIALWDIGAHSLVFIPARGTHGCCEFSLNPEDEGFSMNNAPTDLIPPGRIDDIRNSPNVADASAFLGYRIRATKSSGTWILGGFGTDRPVAFSATVAAESQIIKGRFLKPRDSHMIMVEREFAAVQNLDVGSKLLLADREFEVIGIVAPPLRPGKANIYMEISELQSIINIKSPFLQPVNAVLVESKSAFHHSKAKTDLMNILGKNAVIASYGCSNPGIEAMGINRRTANVVFILVILIMLAVAIKTQYSSILERKYDFGVLKAIGWTDNALLSQILAETLFQTILGGMAGGVAAILIATFSPLEDLSLSLSPPLTLAAILLPAAGAVIASFFSTLPILNLRTADTLRQL